MESSTIPTPGSEEPTEGSPWHDPELWSLYVEADRSPASVRQVELRLASGCSWTHSLVERLVSEESWLRAFILAKTAHFVPQMLVLCDLPSDSEFERFPLSNLSEDVRWRLSLLKRSLLETLLSSSSVMTLVEDRYGSKVMSRACLARGEHADAVHLLQANIVEELLERPNFPHLLCHGGASICIQQVLASGTERFYHSIWRRLETEESIVQLLLGGSEPLSISKLCHGKASVRSSGSYVAEALLMRASTVELDEDLRLEVVQTFQRAIQHPALRGALASNRMLKIASLIEVAQYRNNEAVDARNSSLFDLTPEQLLLGVMCR